MTELQKKLNAKLESLNLYTNAKKQIKDCEELDELIEQTKEEIKTLIKKIHFIHSK